jgi:hypothetical protein
MFTVEDAGFAAELAASAFVATKEEIVACAVLPAGAA